MPRLLHGGDYNAEQWPREIWAEDDRLMSLAHWNETTLGVFAWVSLEPEEGRFDLDWLQEVMDIQAKAGRVVGLSTPSGSPPAWLSKKYPETLRVGADGVRRKHGNRVNYCWSSPIYREKCRAVATELAKRLGNHPALAFWHVSNEFGGECHCDICQAEFREWLKRRYGSLDKLNEAYWSRFWGHTYTDWEQIESPGDPHGETSIICLTVDWKRFTTDRIVDFYLNEAHVLRQVSPEIPITTNLMGVYPGLNSWKLAPHLDFASWDSYPWFGSRPSDLNSWIHTAFSHDLCRGVKAKPFLLMECTPSSSNWYPIMALKRPNAHKLEGLQAIAHGSDGVQYFQWRQGRGGSEQFHGAVVAHNQRQDARVFQEIADLGKTLETLAGVAGAETKADVAIVFDWENMWAIDSVAAPRAKKRDYVKTILEHYRAFWEAGIAVDIISPDYLSSDSHKLVVAPMLFMTSQERAEGLAKCVENGGSLVLTYWSCVVNESVLAHLGGFPAPLRQALGIWCEEIDALYDGQVCSVIAEHSELLDKGAKYHAADLCERIHAEGAETLACYGSEFYEGEPALTRNRYGRGWAYYVASRNESSFNRDFLTSLARELEICPCVKGAWSEGVTVQCRHGESADYLFVLNCSDREASVSLDETGLSDAIGGDPVSARFVLPAFGSRVLERRRVGIAGPVTAGARST